MSAPNGNGAVGAGWRAGCGGRGSDPRRSREEADAVTTVASELRCQGCGEPIPPSRGGPQRKWCSHRCRKRQYAGVCVDCGAPTNGYDGPGTASERCHPCARTFYRWWTRERIVEAIQLFADRYGRPPAASDFDPANARAKGQTDRAARFKRDNDYPHATTVVQEFGTWNQAIEAAGFPATPAKAGGPGSTPDAEYIEAVRLHEQHGTIETARRLGLTPKGVRYRVAYARAHGLTDPTKKAPRSGNSRRRDP